MCFETVEGARPSNSMIWHTQSSRGRNAMNARTLFSSARALNTAIRSRMSDASL